MEDQTSKVSGIVQIEGTPVERTVRAFSYEARSHEIDAEPVNISRSLGHATSDPDTGEYTINLLAGYGDEIFVVAFDDYGAEFTPDLTVAVGDRVHPTTPNGHVWETTSAGTLPSEEPEWAIDTEIAQLYGTASMIAKPFYRPMVQGPVAPDVTTPEALSYEETILADSPLAYITFDDATADDISGNDNHGIMVGSPTTGGISLVAGDQKYSVTFTGSEYVNLSTLAGSLSAKYTLEAWVKTGNSSTGQYGLATFSAHGSSYGNILRLVQKGDVLSLIKENGAENDGSIVINDDQPHHIVLVAETSKVTVYIDGQEDILIDEGISLGGAEYLSFGQEYDPGGPSDFFKGTVDEIAVYSSSLTSTKVIKHFEAKDGDSQAT